MLGQSITQRSGVKVMIKVQYVNSNTHFICWVCARDGRGLFGFTHVKGRRASVFFGGRSIRMWTHPQYR